MRVLVTGHDGYIGQVMVPVLLEAGHEVVGLDTFFYGDRLFDAPRATVPSIHRDMRDVTPADLEGFDAVVCLGALSNDALGDLDPQLTHAINHRACVRLAESAKAAGVERYVFSSSCSLYGASDDEALTEDSGFNPLTAYGETKILVERDVAPLADRNFCPVFMRNATAYGVSPSLRADLMVNNLVGYAVTTGRVLIMSDGTPWRPLVHIEDISLAFAAVLDAPADAIRGEAFNVGVPDENYRVREVAEMVQETVPGSRVEYSPGAAPDARNYRVSFAKIAHALPAFRPRWTVRAGVEELHEAYLAHGLTQEEFLSSRYLRIRSILEHRDAGRLDKDLRWTATAAHAIDAPDRMESGVGR